MKIDIVHLAGAILSVAVPGAAPIIAGANALEQLASSGEHPHPAVALAQAARLAPAPAAPPATDTHLNHEKIATLQGQVAALLAKVQVLEHAQSMHMVATAALTGAIAPAAAVQQLLELEQEAHAHASEAPAPAETPEDPESEPAGEPPADGAPVS